MQTLEKIIGKLVIFLFAYFTANFFEPYYWFLFNIKIPFSSFEKEPNEIVMQNSINIIIGLLIFDILYLLCSYAYEKTKFNFSTIEIRNIQFDFFKGISIFFLKSLLIFLISWDTFSFWSYLATQRYWDASQISPSYFIFIISLLTLSILLFGSYYLLLFEPGIDKYASCLSHWNKYENTIVSKQYIRLFYILAINFFSGLRIFFFDSKISSISFVLFLLIITLLPKNKNDL